MRIVDDVKLDFKDVLFVPHRSTLNSRSEVSLERTYTFRNSKQTWTGVPVVAANMDGVGTFEMHNELSKHRMLTAAVKHYELSDWIDARPNHRDFIIPSIGIGED